MTNKTLCKSTERNKLMETELVILTVVTVIAITLVLAMLVITAVVCCHSHSVACEHWRKYNQEHPDNPLLTPEEAMKAMLRNR